MIEWKQCGQEHHGYVDGDLRYKVCLVYGKTMDDKSYDSWFRPLCWSTFGCEVIPNVLRDSPMECMYDCECHNDRYPNPKPWHKLKG